jgi:hypothetical protein
MTLCPISTMLISPVCNIIIITLWTINYIPLILQCLCKFTQSTTILLTGLNCCCVAHIIVLSDWSSIENSTQYVHTGPNTCKSHSIIRILLLNYCTHFSFHLFYKTYSSTALIVVYICMYIYVLLKYSVINIATVDTEKIQYIINGMYIHQYL